MTSGFCCIMFYHIKNLQSTKTPNRLVWEHWQFYHIKNLQSTKTLLLVFRKSGSFITLRIYKVLKQMINKTRRTKVLSH